MLKSHIRAEDYRSKARDASAMAEASTLDRVREKHELAAATWLGMAKSEESRDLRRLDLLLAAFGSPAAKGSGLANDEPAACPEATR